LNPYPAPYRSRFCTGRPLGALGSLFADHSERSGLATFFRAGILLF
jgi:hypothetical protein